MFSVNTCWLEGVLYCAAEGLRSFHGTGTRFPVASEGVPLSDSNAKSIRPECGFTMMSCSCPARFPEMSLTCAPTSLLARTVVSFMRPVAVRCLVLQLWPDCVWLEESFGFDGADCAREDAESSVQVAQMIVTLRNVFVISRFLRFCFRETGATKGVVMKQINLDSGGWR